MNPVVLTIYGTGEVADYVTVAQFEDGKKASDYIKMIDGQPLADGKWVRTEWVSDFTRYELTPKKKTDYDWLFPRLDDRSIQKVLREVDSQQLSRALKGSSDEIKKRVESNMSKRAWSMMEEDMDFMGPVPVKAITENKEYIAAIVMHLIDNEEIPDFTDPTIKFEE
jgi:hypothetical protein